VVQVALKILDESDDLDPEGRHKHNRFGRYTLKRDRVPKR
jgi:hypothetical protein